MTRALPFVKMHGAGNDFLMVARDDLDRCALAVDAPLVARLCDRRRGVGADGLIVIGPHGTADFAMSYYNRDGGEAEMCGNGARCAFAFARELGLVGEGGGVCATASGPVGGGFPGDAVAVALPPPRDLVLDASVAAAHPFDRLHSVNTGVPHLVIPVDDLEAVAVSHWGRILREDPAFAPAGTNVDWVAREAHGEAWLVRTYERGVEAETLACGTGASAVALVLATLGLAASPVDLLTRGGDRLTIEIQRVRGETRLRLIGPAVAVFSGEVIIHD
ncbi:diaminopimelate epimerase [bacterium]|nr:diaminopimelate epimerase [bacterium]MBU1072556.1 diaminopimelate epimerase [bacterium]MBU1674174.1 diaminopimelate epimerase [bacterium]